VTEIPPTHPRYASLKARERLVEGVRTGITSEAGLIAHGRGEAFDYLLGEGTVEEAHQAQRVAAAMLLLARRPVVSVNGNVAALAADQVVQLQRHVTTYRSAIHAAEPRMLVEVNLFHRTERRVGLITDRLKAMGAVDVLGTSPDMRVPGLDHDRALCSSKGVGSADVVLIPLEDGDRAEALRAWGRQVIAIDLNPLARTSRKAHVTIVDELTRALPGVAKAAGALVDRPRDHLRTMVSSWDNRQNLGMVLQRIARRLEELDGQADGEAI
jgi:4-phosphopantoate--beta-alanine ligase